MLIVSSIISISLIIIISLTNSMIINYISSISGAPMYGAGGSIVVFNKNSHKVINETNFNDFWEYPVEWCNMKNKYDGTNINIKIFPTSSVKPCTYDKMRMNYMYDSVHKFQVLDFIAIIASFFELLIVILFDIGVCFNIINFEHKRIICIPWICMLLQLSATILIGIDVCYLIPYELGKYVWQSDLNPVKTNMLNIYICFICMLIIFNILFNTLHKWLYIHKKIKGNNEEKYLLIQ